MSRRRSLRALASLGSAVLTASVVAVAPVAVHTVAAAGGLAVTEVAPWASGSSPYAADWFELTNSSAAAISLGGWKVDDNSNSFAAAVTLNGVTTINPGESVIFIETSSAATVNAFLSFWFGSTPPAGLQVGTYSGSGVGLGTGGDAVNVYDNGGTLRANVVFGASPSANPFATFDNAAKIDGTISTLSAVGTNGAFAAGTAPQNAIGSPGRIASPGVIRITETAPWSSGNSSLGADWFELTNTGGTAVDITGWRVDDNSFSFAASLALNGITSIAPGESVIFIESNSPATIAAAFKTLWFGATPPAGLQIGTYTGAGIGLSTGGDAVVIYDSSGTEKARVAFGASPGASPFTTFDNTVAADNVTITTFSAVGVNQAFAVTDSAAATSPTLIGSPGRNVVAAGSGPTTTVAPTTTVPPGSPWPGGTTITPVDELTLVDGNLSGLAHEPGAGGPRGTLWAVVNNPGTLFGLTWNGTRWVASTTKTIVYPDGTGNPDSEGVTLGGPTAASGIFVGTERNNSNAGVSRNAILRYDPTVAGATISATGLWDLTADLPVVGANLGIETVTWLPDTYLVANGFLDEATGLPYSPATYPNHGTGLFAVGIEGTGDVYVYALNLSGSTFTRVARFSSGFPQVMASDLDLDTGVLWAHCDNGCLNQTTALRISPTTGRFVVTATYAAPSGMPTGENFEGMAIAPSSACVNGVKPIWFADDGDGRLGAVIFPTDGFSLVEGTIDCVLTPPAEVPEFPASVIASLSGLVLVGGALALTRRRRTAI